MNICDKKRTFIFYKQSNPHFQTRFKTNFNPPTANLTKFQKAVHDTAIKFFNNLPHNIKELTNETKSTVSESFKKFLLINSFII